MEVLEHKSNVPDDIVGSSTDFDRIVSTPELSAKNKMFNCFGVMKFWFPIELMRFWVSFEE